jgi:hypothetical protein
MKRIEGWHVTEPPVVQTGVKEIVKDQSGMMLFQARFAKFVNKK